MAREYQVVQAGMLHELEREVNRFITQGNWQPIGGISVVLQKVNDDQEFDDMGKDKAIFRQAMIR